MSLVAELRRRNVFRVAAAYLVVGWLLTEVLTTILPTLGAPEWTSRAVILIFAFGFIPAVVFSWFYELTPEGIKREEDVDRDDSAHLGGARKLDYVTVAAVVVLIVFVGLFSARQTGDDMLPEADISDASVAVLPFANMSNDQDNEYFSDGLTETLLHMLAQVPELKVAARTSSFAFKNKNINVREIARALGVAHILEGSVQRAGDRVRITAQLIRASDGFHVWSESYDRTVDDIFDVQDEIANKVGVALSASLLGEGEPQMLAGVNTTDPDAYDLYLQARKARMTYSYAGLQAAEDLLKGALLIDPDFLDAKTELASSYIHQMETGLMTMAEGVTEVLAITDQVLAARPDDPEARATKVYASTMQTVTSGDIQSAFDAVAQLEAIVGEHPGELQPKILLVRVYTELQQPEKALPILESALEADPYNPQILYELGAAYLRMGQRDEARASMEKSLEYESRQPNAYVYLAEMSLQDGDGVGYVKNVLKALEVDAEDHELPGILAEFLYSLDLIEQGDDLRNRVLTLSPTSEIAYRTELVRAIASGDHEAANASARRAIEDDVGERQRAYTGAVRYLLRHAALTGTVDDKLAWLEQQAPDMFDLASFDMLPKKLYVQGELINAWHVSLPRDEVLHRLEVLIEKTRSVGFDPMEEAHAALNIYAMRGEVEKAVDVALERILNQSVAVNLGWRETFGMPHFAEVVKDPRVQVAMQRWEAEEIELREAVQSYLADLQATS
jgi:TolB-like protein/tetratricopeptide (TPR) repeat protein